MVGLLQVPGGGVQLLVHLGVLLVDLPEDLHLLCQVLGGGRRRVREGESEQRVSRDWRMSGEMHERGRRPEGGLNIFCEDKSMIVENNCNP